MFTLANLSSQLSGQKVNKGFILKRSITVAAPQPLSRTKMITVYLEDKVNQETKISLGKVPDATFIQQDRKIFHLTDHMAFLAS